MYYMLYTCDLKISTQLCVMMHAFNHFNLTTKEAEACDYPWVKGQHSYGNRVSACLKNNNDDN